MKDVDFEYMKDMNFDSMISQIALGLYEKAQINDKYPYSGNLSNGINLFSAFAFYEKQFDLLEKLDETSFITEYATKPVKYWFEGWNDSFVSIISNYPLYNTKELIELSDKDKRDYSITDECADLISNSFKNEKNMLSYEQNYVYQMMIKLTPKMYTDVREFIVQHPICNNKDLQDFKIEHVEYPPDIAKIFESAYEDVPENCYRCPECGWTLTFDVEQPICCNKSCIKSCIKQGISPETIKESDEEKIDSANCQRLKHGVMRFMCIPGQLELEIRDKAEEFGCETELWPEKDRYDIKIKFSTGKVWAIDAKTHRNPYTLAADIKDDAGFFNVEADERFYVIQKDRLDVHPDYCDICNAALKNEKVNEKVKVLTDEELYEMIREEIKNG